MTEQEFSVWLDGQLAEIERDAKRARARAEREQARKGHCNKPLSYVRLAPMPSKSAERPLRWQLLADAAGAVAVIGTLLGLGFAVELAVHPSLWGVFRIAALILLVHVAAAVYRVLR